VLDAAVAVAKHPPGQLPPVLHVAVQAVSGAVISVHAVAPVRAVSHKARVVYPVLGTTFGPIMVSDAQHPKRVSVVSANIANVLQGFMFMILSVITGDTRGYSHQVAVIHQWTSSK